MEQRLVDMTVKEFIEELASKSPAPGGGSASALAGALAAALTSMVANLTIGKKKYAAVEEEMKALRTAAGELMSELLELMDRDTAAFNEVMAAYKLPKDTAEEKQRRSAAIAAATKKATEVPLELARRCVRLLELAQIAADQGNRNAVSDAGVAAAMAQAAFKGAVYNVRVNMPGLADNEYRAYVDEELQKLELKINHLSKSF